MKKKILFIILPHVVEEKKFARVTFLAMPCGVLSIMSFIKDYADVKIFDCNLYENYLELLHNELHNFTPDICGVSLMFDNSYGYLSKVLQKIKEYNTCTVIILGGAATGHSYKSIFENHTEITAICYGEGELPVLEYLKSDAFGKGWITKNNYSNIERNYALTLDNFIDIDYSLVDVEKYQKHVQEFYSPFMHGQENKRQFYVVTSRGCPFSCIFCMNSLNPNKTIRYASVETIIHHIEKLIDSYGMNVLTFYDDQILHNRARAKELFKRLQKYKLRIEMPNGISPAFIDEELSELMWNAGVDSLWLAIESGSKDVLKMMKKPVNLDQVRQLMPILRKHNYFITTFIVLGIPGETDVHRQESNNFFNEVKFDVVSPKVATPVYGSKLRQDCIEKGYIEDSSFGNFDLVEAVLNTPEYSAEYLEGQRMIMNWRFNFVENYRMQIGDYQTAKHYFQYVANKYPHEAFAWYYLNKAKEKLCEEQDCTEFNKCIQNNPEWIKRFKNLGVNL